LNIESRLFWFEEETLKECREKHWGMREGPIAGEILGICRNCLHRLAAWGLLPSAIAESGPSRASECCWWYWTEGSRFMLLVEFRICYV